MGGVLTARHSAIAVQRVAAGNVVGGGAKIKD